MNQRTRKAAGEGSRAEGPGTKKKIWAWRVRDEKPGKNGGKLEPLTKVLEYRVGRKK